MRCRHCQRQPGTRPRGLCWRCYDQPAIRALYRPKELLSVFVSDGLGAGRKSRGLPPFPTEAPPGSPEKIAVLHERARLGCDLFHPLDATDDEPAELDDVG